MFALSVVGAILKMCCAQETEEKYTHHIKVKDENDGRVGKSTFELLPLKFPAYV